MKAIVLKIYFLMMAASCVAQANVRGILSSQFLARGEQAVFEIRFDEAIEVLPVISEIKDVVVESLGYGRPQMMPGRRIESSYQFSVSSYAVGVHEIPPVEVIVSGKRLHTKAMRFEIFDPNDLKWQEVDSKPEGGGDTIRYASIIKIPDRKYYENQSMETEIKIYVPTQLAGAVVDWGVPEFERKGLAVWRFEPSETRGRVKLLGQQYSSLSYPTTMTVIKSGEVEIGPATVRLTYQKTVFDRFARRLEFAASLAVPKFSFESTPLPEGAPEGFDNAVGNFSLGTAITDTEVTEGEPLAVDVVVTGSGNLDNLRSPKMVDESGWKVYDATATPRGVERRDISGTVVFSQFIRPLEMKTGIPPFKLVFFDPETEKYETVTTDSIPLKMIPATGGRNFESSGPPQAMPMPVERMTDILGLIDTGRLVVAGKLGFPWWLGHAIAAVIAFALLGKAFWMRYSHRFEKDARELRKKKDYRVLSKAASSDGLDFLRTAGGFVEQWLTPEKDTDLQGILEERDSLCFRASKDGASVPSGRRKEILRRLKKAAFSILLISLAGFSVSNSSAEDIQSEAKAAYDAAKYEDAAKLWLDAGSFENLSADTLYNIGNSAYRMGAPGQAALYYRRALAADGGHGEARQNLRFIERKYGAITINRPKYQYTLAKIPLTVWRGGLWTGAWLLVIALLIYPATRRSSKWRVGGVVGLVVGPLLMSLGALGWHYYPDDADFASLARQAVVVGPNVVLHSDAARTSPEVIDAPPGSLAEVIKRSGRWAYIGFATKTRGWVPAKSIEMIVPEEKPEPPKIRKSEGDGSSA
jgi:hypothetical protein